MADNSNRPSADEQFRSLLSDMRKSADDFSGQAESVIEQGRKIDAKFEAAKEKAYEEQLSILEKYNRTLRKNLQHSEDSRLKNERSLDKIINSAKKQIYKKREKIWNDAAKKEARLEEGNFRNVDTLFKKFGFERLSRGGKLEASPNNRAYQDAKKVAEQKESMINKVKQDYHKKYEAYVNKKENGNVFQKMTAKAPDQQKYIDQIDAIEGRKKSGPSKLGMAASGLGLVPQIDSVESVFGLIRKAYDLVVGYINEKLLPTQSELNKSFGFTASNIKNINAQALKTGDQFWDLGLSFEQGAKDVTHLGLAMNTTYIPDKNLKGLLTLSEYVGVGAEQAGKLANSFIASGLGLDDLNQTMKDATGIANKYSVPVNMIRKEFAESPDMFQRYGAANRKTFLNAIGYVKRYNLSIQEVGKTFGDTFDTFDKTSEVAAKLNQAFGTNLDSIKLLTAYNPDQRFKMIREALQAQGITWDKLTGSMSAYKGVIKNVLQIGDDEAARMFGSQKMIDKIKQSQKATEDWENGLKSLRKVLYDNTRELTILAKSFINLLARIFGFSNGIEGASDIAMIFKGAVEGAAKGMDALAASVPEGGLGIVGFFRKINHLIDQAVSSMENLLLLAYRYDPTHLSRDIKGKMGINDLVDEFRSIDPHNTSARQDFSDKFKSLSAKGYSGLTEGFSNQLDAIGQKFNINDYDKETSKMKTADIVASTPSPMMTTNALSNSPLSNDALSVTPNYMLVNNIYLNGNLIAKQLVDSSQGK